MGEYIWSSNDWSLDGKLDKKHIVNFHMVLIRFAKTIQRFEPRLRFMSSSAAADTDIRTIRKQIDTPMDTPTKINFTASTANAAGTIEYYLDSENTRERNDITDADIQSSSNNLVGLVFQEKQAIVGPAGKRSPSGSQLNSETLNAGSDTLNTGTGAFTECLEAIAHFFSRWFEALSNSANKQWLDWGIFHHSQLFFSSTHTRREVTTTENINHIISIFLFNVNFCAFCCISTAIR